MLVVDAAACCCSRAAVSKHVVAKASKECGCGQGVCVWDGVVGC